jgi:DNA-binding transcriptional regulator GbsR (MarR family)
MEATDSLAQINFLADEIGELVYNWGFKRVHGRIWTHLFLSNRPLDASDLVKRLDISKALISISLRELLDLKLIAEIGKSTKGTHLYRTNPDLVRVFLNILKFREKLLFAKVKSAHTTVESMSAEDKQKSELSDVRILELKKLMAGADSTLDHVINLDPEQIAQWQILFAPVENEKILLQDRSSKNTESISVSSESSNLKPQKQATSDGLKASASENSIESFQLSPGVSLAKGSSTLF